MHGQLRERVRLVADRQRFPTAAIIDSQSEKGRRGGRPLQSQLRRRESCRAGGYAGPGIRQDNARKRHIAVDVCGLLLTILVATASVQGRDTAKPLLWNPNAPRLPSVRLAWADGGYSGKLAT